MARRRKKRTHVKPDAPPAAGGPSEANRPPKSFVVRHGAVGRSVSGLVRDVRRTMEPNTAARLRERHNNRLRDYVNVAGQLGVTHFLIFSRTDNGTNLRIGRTPRGPTLVFKVHSYSLARDVVSVQKKPKSPGSEYLTAPLLVLNNFNAASEEDQKTMKLMTSMFQNMFPAIDVQKMHLSDARRVLLLNYNSETNRIDFRHYGVGVRPVGVSKSVKKILAPGTMSSTSSASYLPNLEEYGDIADYVLREAAASESEAEDGDATVELGQDFVGRGNRRAEQRAVRLTELGPRMELELTKIQTGLCGGEVLYHRYIKKSSKEVKDLAKARQQKIQEKARRRAEQEKNVERKKAEREELRRRTGKGEDEDDEEEEQEDEEEEVATFDGFPLEPDSEDEGEEEEEDFELDGEEDMHDAEDSDGVDDEEDEQHIVDVKPEEIDAAQESHGSDSDEEAPRPTKKTKRIDPRRTSQKRKPGNKK